MRVRTRSFIALALCLGLVSTASAADPDDMLLFNAQTGGPISGLWSLTYTATPFGASVPLDGGYNFFNDPGLTPNPNIPRTGDLNGDGIADLATIGSNGNQNLYLGRNTGTVAGLGRLDAAPVGNPGWPENFVGTWDTNVEHFVADVNGDGYGDALTVRPNAANPSAWLWEAFHSDADGFEGAAVTTSWSNAGNAGNRPLVGDFNGDGRADIAQRYENGVDSPTGWIQAVFSGPGGLQEVDPGLTNFAHGIVAQEPGHFATLVGDLNGDGKDDIVEVDDRYGNGSWVWVAGLTGPDGGMPSGIGIGTGGSSFSIPFGVANAGTSVHVPLLGDMNGDGLDDIVQYWEYPNPNGAPGDVFAQWLVAYTQPGGVLGTFDDALTLALSADQAGNIPMIAQFTPEPTSLVLLSLGSLVVLRRRR